MLCLETSGQSSLFGSVQPMRKCLNGNLAVRIMPLNSPSLETMKSSSKSFSMANTRSRFGEGHGRLWMFIMEGGRQLSGVRGRNTECRGTLWKERYGDGYFRFAVSKQVQ